MALFLGLSSCGPSSRPPPPSLAPAAPSAPPANVPPSSSSAAAPEPSLDAPSFQPQADDAFPLLRSEALGPVEIGLPEHDVRRLVGEPKRRSARVLEGATGLYVETWDFARGVSIWMGANNEAGPLRVQSVHVVRPSTFRTRRGLSVGASAEQVRGRYADHIDEASSNAERLVAGSIYGGLIFELRAGTVTSIFLGASAE